MNEKLINIHKYLFDNKLTKSDLNTWVSNVSSNDEIQTNIHKYLFDNKLTKSDFDTWKTNVGLKKKDSLDSIQEEAASVSPSQEKAKPTLSVGGKQVKTTPSDSSAGENKVNPFDRNQKSIKPSSSQALLGLTTYGPKEGKDKELLDKFAKPLSKEEEVLLNKAGDSALLNMKESGTGGKVEQTSYLDKKNEAINKETSLMSAKIDAENSREILNEFKSSTQVTPDMEQTIQDDIMNEVQNEGLWNNIKQGASKAWNEVSPHIRLGSVTLPSGAQEMIKTDETFLNKRKEEERNLMISKEGFKPEEITDEVLTQRAINSEIKSRIEDKKISLVNDYMDGLPSDVRSKLKFNANMSLQASAPEAIEADKLFKYVKATDTFLEDMSKKIFELQDIAKENKGLNQEQFSEYNSLISEAESLIESRNSSYEKYVSIKDKITTAEEDYDFLKRTYGFENTFNRFLNVASDFGLNMAQFANMAKYGPSKDLAAMQIADLRNEKDEYFEGKLQKEVENLQSVNDYLDYIGGVFVDQSINLALGVPAKGAFLLPTLFASSAGGKYTELTTSNLKGETNYTPLQMYLSSGVYGAAETAESATLKMIGKGKSVVSKALKNEPSRKILSESLTKSVYNGGKEFVKDLGSEFKEEITTSVAQKISDIIILDMESKDVFKDFSSEIKNIAGSTLTMTVGLNIAPQAFGKIVKAFSPKDYTVALDRNNKTIEELSKIINNENVSEIAKKEAKSKIDDIVNANDKSLKALLMNMSEMNSDLLDEVVKNEIKSSELRNKAKEINNDKTLSKSDKAVLLDGIKKEYIKSESDRESILNGSKTSFDILSKEKQEQLNNKAKSEIIKEKGLDVDAEVSVEEINKKARLDYNNKVKSDTQNKTLYINRDPKRGEVDAIPETLPKGYEYYKIVSNSEELRRWKEQKTKNQENEEGITAKQEEPTREVSSIETTTAQAEGETLLQEEVDTLRAKEQEELLASIPNADLLLTDGKVDKKKLTLPEDIAKFEEIYNKYDKLISPLLEDIKTQDKDAIQKQSTGEIPIQPEATISEEVEQGKPETKPKEPTKQDEKEVKPKKDKTEKLSDKEQIKELKGLVSDLFNAAKEAVKITKDRFKTIEDFKKDATKMVNNGVKDLSDIKFKDRAKRQAQSVINSITDKNINEKLNKINKILDSVSKSDTKEVGANLDKEVKKVSNPKYTRVKSDGKVPKSKVTDNIKKRMEQEKKKFSKIKNPTNLQKKYFVDIMSKLLDKGIKERKKIEETRKNKSQRKSDKVASDVLVKAGKSRGFVSIDINDSVKLDEAFESGGVIYNGKIYNNKKSLIKDATSENESKGKVKLQKVSLSQTPSNADSNRSWWDRNISDTIRKYKYKNFSARTFFESMITDSNRDFINKNFRLPLQKYSEVIGRKQAEFNDIRDGFFNEILDLKDTKKSKLTLPTATFRFLISKSRDLKAKKNKKGTERLWAFSGKNEIKFSVKINGEEKSGTFFGLVDFFDNTIKQETNKDVIEKLKVDKENFKNKYFSFDEMNNQGVAVLFNMIRQPDGLQKFLNTGFTHQDAIAIVDYVNSNEFIRDIADKSTDIFQKIRDYVNPTLDNLGYETLGEVDFLTEEDAMSISKDPEATKKNYEVLKKIYPNGIPEKIPYFPLSTEGLSGVSESATLSFFEQSDNPNGDYSLLYPSLFSRTAGGKLNLNNLSVFSSFDTASKDAITLVEGQEIMTNTRNLFSNPANNIAFTSAYGKDWVRAFQSKVTTIVKDNAYEESMSKSGKFVKFLVKTSGISRVSQLAINYFSSVVQLTSSGVTYFKEDNLKVLPKLIKDLKDKSKRRDVLDGLKKSYNEIVNSDNYKGRVNKRKDSIEISLVKSVKGKEGFSFIQSLMTDALYLTTLSDMLSVVMLTPIHYYKHNTNNGKTVSENMDNFFSEEVNTTLQSNASFYMGTTFYSKFAAITGLGSYLQAPRQAFEQIAYTIISLPKSKNIVDFSTKTASIIGTGSFAYIIPSMLRDFLRGDDEDEETQSDADQKTSMLKTANEVFDSILDSMGFGGTSISVVKNAALAKYSPDVLGIAIQPSEIRANDILIASTKALPNIGIRLRALDKAIDKKEIYTNTDQLIYALETGFGFGGAFIKKQADYISAISKEYYDYSDYWDLASGKVTLDEFKSFDTQINTYKENLEEFKYPKYNNGNTLNLSFLNEEQRLNINKMSLSQKNEYINEIRVNLIRKDIVDQVVLLKGKDESLNEDKNFYFVRAAKFKQKLSDDFFKHLKDNLKYGKETEFEGLEDRIMSFIEDENISEDEAATILEQVFKSAEDKFIDHIKEPIIKQAEGINPGKDKAKFIYEKFGDVNSSDNIMYIERISDVIDERTEEEYINFLKSNQK